MKISREEREKIYENAFVLYGRDNQLTVAIEEMAEVIKELTKAIRHSTREKALAEEVADALICLEQVQRIFRIENCVEEFVDLKVKRLAERLKKDFPGDKNAPG